MVLLVLVGTGCATSRVVRLDLSDGRPIVYTPRAGAEPAELGDDEFEDAVQTLAHTVPRSSGSKEAALRLFNLGDHREEIYEPAPGSMLWSLGADVQEDS